MKKILILGVTASGKGHLAFELARALNGEILSVDSMKVYRRMDIGTAKPPLERRRQIPHWLIDVVEPWESFSVDRYLDLADKAINRIRNAGKPVIAVGGTALYIKTLLFGLFEGPGTRPEIRERLRAEAAGAGLAPLHARLQSIDPEAASRIHPNDEKRILRALEVFELTGRPISSFQTQFDAPRPDSSWLVIGLRRDKDLESRRINARVKKMIDDGLVDEVRGLLAEPYPLSPQSRCAIGYAEIIEYLQGKVELEKAVEHVKINTRKFAKAQRTWYKTFRFVHWLDVEAEQTLEDVAARALTLIDENK